MEVGMRGRRPALLRVALMVCVLLLILNGATVLASDSRCPLDREARPAPSSDLDVGVERGEVAEDFTLPDLDGQEVSLSEWRGCVVIVEFWASWCPPCLASARHLDALQERYEDRGLVVLGVSLDSTRSSIDRFLEAVGDVGIVLWGSASRARAIADLYRVEAIPRAVVVDREGIIRYVGHPAYITESLLAPLW